MAEKLKMKEVRCPLCDKKLCVTNGDVEIKCTRRDCGVIVNYKADTGEMKTYKEPDRETSSGKRFYW